MDELGKKIDKDSNNFFKQLPKVSQERMELAQYFIECYIASRQGLTKLGILRTERNLQGDYAEWLAAEIMGLKLVQSTVQKAYDAVDDVGKTYQIKSRLVESLSQNTSFDLRSIDSYFDYLVCVFLSPKLDLLAIIRVPYKVVRELGIQTKTTFRFRWNKQVSKDPRIEWIWTKETSKPKTEGDMD